MEPGSEVLNQLCQRIVHNVDPSSSSWATFNVDMSSSSEEMFKLVASVLIFVAQTPSPITDGGSLGNRINPPPKHLPATFKVWLARTILQTVWRWRRIQHHTTTIDFYWITSTCKKSVAEGDQVPTLFKTIWILILTICLGATVDVRDLYPPNNECAASPPLNRHVIS